MRFSRFCKTISLSFTIAALCSCGGGGSKPAKTASSSVQGVGNSSVHVAASSLTLSSVGVSASSAADLPPSSSSISSSISGLAPSSSSSLTSESSLASSSISSSSSSSVKASCTASKGDVFIDGVCPGWRDVSIFEQFIADPNIYREIRDGSAGDLVTQKIVDSGIPGHDQVLDVQYNGNSPLYGGVVRMFNLESDPDGVDMSEYATGKLVFDVNVISRGDENTNLEVALECGWPCNTHEQVIAVSQLNQWQTFAISVKDLIAQGLDIKRVRTGFLIQAPWRHQANAHFQVDNVRWVKGDPEPEAETQCFANHMGFNDWDGGNNSYYFKYDLFNADVDTSGWLSQLVPNINVWPQWSQASDVWGVAISEPVVRATGVPVQFPSLDDCIRHGTLSVRVYLPASYVADGKMKVGLYVSDIFGNSKILGQPLSASAMTADGWTRLSVKLDDYTFDAIVIFTGVYFDANGKSPAVAGEVAIDNFVISQKAAPQ